MGRAKSSVWTTHLRDKVDERMNHLYTPVRRHHALAVLGDADEEEKKKKRKAKQGVLLHASSNIRRE